jgi:hypothetical protein
VLAWPLETRMRRKPHGQRWGEGLDSVMDHLQHDGRFLPHAAGDARPSPRRERRKE